MNNINFDQLGGFPMETETLLEMQKAYSIFNAYGELAGDKVIVKGCELVGNTVADGFIYVDGELLVFKGGQVQTAIIIKQIEVSVEFETKEMKPVYYERYATFGSGLESIPWADFKRVYPLSSALFLNEVRMYTGLKTDLPWGWHLADGENGTEDLRNSFPIPYNPDNPDYNKMLKVGGNDKVTPTGIVGYKDISITMPRDGWGTTGGVLGTAVEGRLIVGSGNEEIGEGLGSLRAAGTDKSASGGHNHSLNMYSFDNRPQFIALGFIQFTARL